MVYFLVKSAVYDKTHGLDQITFHESGIWSENQAFENACNKDYWSLMNGIHQYTSVLFDTVSVYTVKHLILLLSLQSSTVFLKSHFYWFNCEKLQEIFVKIHNLNRLIILLCFGSDTFPEKKTIPAIYIYIYGQCFWGKTSKQKIFPTWLWTMH